MPLSDYKPKRTRIEFDGGSFDVRAVDLPTVAEIVDAHREVVDRIATMIRVRQELGQNLQDPQVFIDMFSEVVRESPYVAASLVSMCADEPESYRIALTLPLTVLISALRAIGDLTFTDGEVLKKLFADVKALMDGFLPPTLAAAA